MGTRKSTIKKYLEILIEIQKRVDKGDIIQKSICREFRVVNQFLRHAIELGYFSKDPFTKKWHCHVVKFQPIHARKIAEREKHYRPTEGYSEPVSEVRQSTPTTLLPEIPPRIEDVIRFCEDRKSSVDARKWFDYYESTGWKIGSHKMIDWRACIRMWENRTMSTKYVKDISRFTDDEIANDFFKRFPDLAIPCKGISEYTIDELLDEIKRRGGKGTVNFVHVREL